MKTYFSNNVCINCNAKVDHKYGTCPHCHKDMGNPDYEIFRNHVPMPWWKEMVFFLVGLLGLQVIATIAQFIAIPIIAGNHPGYSSNDILLELQKPGNLAWIEFAAYGTLFILVFFLAKRQWKDMFKSFKGWKPYVFALAGLGVTLTSETVYQMITSNLLQLAGLVPSENLNQSTIIGIAVAAPAFSLIFFGIIGPFVEEMAYRVGLFGLTSRLGKVLGYVISGLVFGLIHFSFETAFNFANLADAIYEWVNLPIYVFSGLVFCFLYDKFGFASSYVAHSTNNLLSILMIIIQQNTPQV